jgi:hypothetical protein
VFACVWAGPAAAGAPLPTWHPGALMVSPCCIVPSRCSLWLCADVAGKARQRQWWEHFGVSSFHGCYGSV